MLFFASIILILNFREQVLMFLTIENFNTYNLTFVLRNSKKNKKGKSTVLISN